MQWNSRTSVLLHAGQPVVVPGQPGLLPTNFRLHSGAATMNFAYLVRGLWLGNPATMQKVEDNATLFACMY